MLARLESEGLVAAAVEAQGTRPPRKLFSLTAKGDTLLQAWLQTPVRNGRDFRLEFLTKLYFADQGGTTTALTLIRRQLTASQAHLNRLTHSATASAAADSFAGLVNEFRLGQMEAALDWLGKCEQIYSLRQARERQEL